MIVLLQSYLGMSDAEAVELTVVDCAGRWCWIAWGGQTACAQGTLVDFRERLIRTDMDRRLLERTVELAGEPRLSTGRSCRRISAWPSIPVRWKARAA